MTIFKRLILVYSIIFSTDFIITDAQLRRPCLLHDYDSTWEYAVDLCEKRNAVLLCYKSQKEVRRIINYFFPMHEISRNLTFWLSSDSCDDLTNLTRCLSLVVTGDWPDIRYYLEVSCEHKSFICCPIPEEIDTTSPVSTMISDVTVLYTPSTPTFDNLTLTEDVTERYSTSPSLPSSTETDLDIISTSSSVFTTSVITVHTDHSLSSPPSSSSIKPFCPSVSKRGLVWPDTPAGIEVVLPCPGNSTGNAVWLCNKQDMTWTPTNPNMSECHSTELKNIRDKFPLQTSDETIDQLKVLFEHDSESLQGNDLQDAMSLVSLLPAKLVKECESANHTIRFERAQLSVVKTTAIFSQMMTCDTWSDIAAVEVPKVGSQMLSAADDFALILADSMKNSTHYSTGNPNVVVEILKKKYGQAVTLPLEFGEHSHRGQIRLEGGYDSDLPHDGLISIIYIYYSNMSHILLSEKTGSLNSPVVSTSVSHDGVKASSINGHVNVLVEHLFADRNDTACVFWNFRQHTWDPTGCRLKSSNSTHTLCECNHLTNFAVLMDYQGILADLDDEAFFYITVIGCSISIVCLAICITVFTCYRWQRLNAWGIRYSIHRNLCITLFLGNILLVAGLNQAENHTICAVIAGFLHYFFLSAFSWMLLEGVHIYILLVIVFASKKTHWEKYYIFGYGFPLLVVAVTAAIRPESYGTDDVCWLSFTDGAVWSFTGPVAVILLLNSAALFLAQLKASKISSKSDNIAAIKRWLRVTFILFPILGLTWVLGFLYVGKNYKVVAYLFAILNSLQGLCIFVCHCLMDKRARNMVLNSIRERISSTSTESSSSKKRSRKESRKSLMRDKDRPIGRRDCWRLPWKPWTFHFELNFSRKTQVRPMKESSSEEPEIIQWKKLQTDRII